MLALDIEFRRERFELLAALTVDAPIAGLFGPSGSGKSTLLNIIAGLIHPQEGWIKLGDEILFDSSRRIRLPSSHRRIGLVFQDSQLFPHYSVRNNLLYGYKRTSRNERRFRPDDIIDLLSIGHLLDRRPRQLSGGEKQRVALARSLLASPRLLLLDEPMASLDKGLKEQILPFLNRVKSELKLPMVYVSHTIQEILQLTTHLAFIAHGRIYGAGDFHEVLKNHEVMKIAGQLGLENVLPVTIFEHDLGAGCTLAHFSDTRLTLPLAAHLERGTSCFVAVRANEIALSKNFLSGISIQNQIKGRVASISSSADRALVQVEVGATLIAQVTPRALTDMGMQVNDTIYCLVKAQSFSYLNGDPAAHGADSRRATNGSVVIGSDARHAASAAPSNKHLSASSEPAVPVMAP
jgi:molybdate transport system ATP-binding protein